MTAPSTRRGLFRALLAGGALLVAYLAAGLLMDPGGYLGTDTGAKVATLDHMEAVGTWRPELPYWAEAQDPEGRVHPVYDTERIDGRWVHVTTLPMLLAARPLYELGGYRLTLLLPMAGAVGAAFAARSLARRAADDAAGWRAFWIVGLASPITVYALDLWEHAPGVAAMVGAVALLAGVLEDQRPRARAAGAGALLGLAATMRTEAVVYALVAVGACCVLRLRRERRPVDALRTGLASVAAFSAVWAGELALERALGGTDRTGRATGAASRGFGEIGDRAEEAVVGLLAVRPAALSTMVALGAALAGLLALAVRWAARGELRMGRALLAGVGALHLVIVLDGLGFVPGMLAAAPLVVLALTGRPPSPTAAYATVVALGALPLVWVFQYLGGALPQWGGRYALTSCTLLVVVGVLRLPSLDRTLQVGFVGLAALVTLSGAGWLAERSSGVDAWFELATDRPEDVLIARNGFLVREGGAAAAERRWLTAVGADDLEHAVDVVQSAGLDTFATVDESEHAPIELGEGRLLGTSATDFLGTTLYFHTYEV